MFRLFFAWFLCLGIASANADEGSTNRLISDAIPAWRKLKSAEEHVSFTMQERRWATENGQPLDHWSKRSRKKLVRDGSSFLAMISDEGAVGEGYFGANPRYLFNIGRPADTTPYVLRSLDIDASDKVRADLQRQLTIFYSIALSRLFASIPLDELVTDPGFKLKRIEEVLVDGFKCLKVHFAGAFARHKQTFLDSWVILDPARNWPILRSEATFAKFKLTAENEYWPDSGGVSWLRHCKMTSTYPAEHIEENREYFFDRVEQSPIPASTFLLSSFGMPEPDQPVAADYRSNVHYWLIGGALAMFAAAYAIRRRVSRAARTSR